MPCELSFCLKVHGHFQAKERLPDALPDFKIQINHWHFFVKRMCEGLIPTLAELNAETHLSYQLRAGSQTGQCEQAAGFIFYFFFASELVGMRWL